MKTREELITEMKESIQYGKKILLTGSGGVGKTYMMNKLSEEYDIIKTSSTGVSAILLNGVTAHSFFRLGYANNIGQLDYNDNKFCKSVGIPDVQTLLSKLKRIISSSDVVLIDEISMVPKNILELIMYRLYQMGLSNFPLILSGDFLQLSPVNGSSLIYDQELLSAFEIKNMNRVFRSDNLEFIKFLNMARVGMYTKYLHYYINDNLLNKDHDPLAVKIFATNKEVDLVNKFEYDKLKTTEQEYKYTISLSEEEANKKSTAIQAFLKNAKIGNINLKIGCRVILIKNLNEYGLINGDIGTIINMYHNAVMVNFDRTGDHIINMELFSNIEYVSENGELKQNIIWEVKALPLMVSYALTIHKSQGASIENLEIHADNIFTESQLYVALSRSSNPEKLNLVVTNNDSNFLRNHIRNVFKDAREFYKNIPDSCQYE